MDGQSNVTTLSNEILLQRFMLHLRRMRFAGSIDEQKKELEQHHVYLDEIKRRMNMESNHES